MNNKARLIAISGICSAASVGAILLVSVAPFIVLILGVVASVAVVIPMLIDGRNLVYSLLIYAVSIAVSVVSGMFLSNGSYVVPVVLFCMPFTIIKVYGESYKVTTKVQHTETLEDPFGQGDDKEVVAVEVNGKRRIPTVVKWVLYYVVLEISLGLTLLVSYLLTPALFLATYSKTLLFWLLVGSAQLIVPLYDILMRGCLLGVSKLLKKIVK